MILSVIDGLYNGDPADPASKLIPLVENWDESLLSLATAAKSTRGTGGMQSKLEAARTATAVGESVIIANGREPNVLARILAGEELGTLFLAKGESIPAWKRWIGYSLPPRGRFVLDDGARKAIAQRGRSLLAIGIVEIDGDFSLEGEVVSLVDEERRRIPRGGLTNFDARFDAPAGSPKQAHRADRRNPGQPSLRRSHSLRQFGRDGLNDGFDFTPVSFPDKAAALVAVVR